MDPRRQIPAVALLGLCLTDCGKDDPTIVGTWTATEIDMQKFPVVEVEGGYMARYGVELRVEDDLSADFGYYSVYSHDGIGMRSEQRMPATVDDDDAPHYLITLSYLGFQGEYAETPGQPGVAAGGGDSSGPGDLRTRAIPRTAGDQPVLDCTLRGDRLDCTLDEGTTPTAIRFARKAEET